MKTLLIASLVVLFSSCVAAKKPAPATPAPMAGGPPTCDEFMCGTNGTHPTGLSNGDRAGAIETIALPSGEVITLR